MKNILRSTVLLSILALAFSAYTFADPILSIQPVTTNASVGDTVTLDVNISNVTDLFAFQFDVSFDPTVLNTVSVTEGSLLPTGGSTFFLGGTIDNVGGTIANNADSLIGAISGVTGSGTLAVLQFTAFAPGASAVDLGNLIFLDSNFSSITPTTSPADVTVTSTVPEP